MFTEKTQCLSGLKCYFLPARKPGLKEKSEKFCSWRRTDLQVWETGLADHSMIYNSLVARVAPLLWRLVTVQKRHLDFPLLCTVPDIGVTEAFERETAIEDPVLKNHQTPTKYGKQKCHAVLCILVSFHLKDSLKLTNTGRDLISTNARALIRPCWCS